MTQYQEKLQLGLERLKKAENDRDLLGLALISMHGALEDYFRSWLAANSQVPSSEQTRIMDRRQVQWLELLELMQKYGTLRQDERSYILRMNELHQEVLHGNAFSGTHIELENYAGYVQRCLARENTSNEAKEENSDRSTQSMRGEDLRMDLSISFREAIFGQEKPIRIPHLEKCKTCDGCGFMKSSVRCSVCNGSGRTEVTRKLKVEIPAGVDSGTRLRVAGEGDAGIRGGSPGDLYIFLFIEKDAEFERDKINLLSEVVITPEQALSGCTLTINTIDATGELKIPSGVRHGEILRLKNRGVPELGNPSHRGDHLVTVKINSPEPKKSANFFR